ncbi:hypothetical protein D3C72_921150 [compost metagenome]
MTAELQRSTYAHVVVVALGPRTITQIDLGIVVETVELHHTVEVIAASGIQPGRVKAEVVAFHLARGAPRNVEVRRAVACQGPCQPLAIPPRQGRIRPQRNTLLVLRIGHTRRFGYVVFVAVAAHPGARLALIQPQFAHAATQRTELAVPNGRGGAEQCQRSAGAWADDLARPIQVPVVTALLQLIGKCTEVNRAIDQRKLRITRIGMHDMQRVFACRLVATTSYQQTVTAGGGTDLQEVGLPRGKISIHDERAIAPERAQFQGKELPRLAQADHAAIHGQTAHLAVLDHVPAPLVVEGKPGYVFQPTGQACLVIQSQIGGRACFGAHVTLQVATLDAHVCP